MTDILDLRFLLRLARETVSDPQGGAERVLALAPPRPALWLAFALSVVGTLFLGEVVSLVLPPSDGTSAIAFGLMQGALLFLMVFGITHIGRAFGGMGTFDGALALVTWLQVVYLLAQAVVFCVILIVPPVAPILSILVIGLFFWLLVNFITVLHGFVSLGMVFVMTLVSFVTFLFALSLVLAILGVTTTWVEVPVDEL